MFYEGELVRLVFRSICTSVGRVKDAVVLCAVNYAIFSEYMFARITEGVTPQMWVPEYRLRLPKTDNININV